MYRLFKHFALPILGLLLVIQLFSPAETNPPVDPKREIHGNIMVDVPVAGLLARSCDDCHSNRRVWPWYSHIAPASWLVGYDVNRGRKALNLSDWAAYNSQ